MRSRIAEGIAFTALSTGFLVGTTACKPWVWGDFEGDCVGRTRTVHMRLFDIPEAVDYLEMPGEPEGDWRIYEGDAWVVDEAFPGDQGMCSILFCSDRDVCVQDGLEYGPRYLRADVWYGPPSGGGFAYLTTLEGWLSHGVIEGTCELTDWTETVPGVVHLERANAED